MYFKPYDILQSSIYNYEIEVNIYLLNERKKNVGAVELNISIIGN